MSERYRLKLKDEEIDLSEMDAIDRCSLAINSNTSVDVLKRLAKDNYWGVRLFVAKNLNTPIELLKQLANDENEDVRKAVVKNLNTPRDVLKKYSKNKNVIKNNWKIINVEDGGYSPGEAVIDYTIEGKGLNFVVSYPGYEQGDIQELSSSKIFKDFCSKNNYDEDEAIENIGNSMFDWEVNGDIRIEEALEDTGEDLSEKDIEEIENLIGSRLDKDIEEYYGFDQDIVDKFNNWKRSKKYKDSKFRDSRLRDMPRVNTLGVTSIKRSPYVKLAIKHDNQNDIGAYSNALDEAYKDLEYDLSNLGNSRMRKELKITYLPLFKHISNKVSKTTLEILFLRLYNTI